MVFILLKHNLCWIDDNDTSYKSTFNFFSSRSWTLGVESEGSTRGSGVDLGVKPRMTGWETGVVGALKNNTLCVSSAVILKNSFAQSSKGKYQTREHPPKCQSNSC